MSEGKEQPSPEKPNQKRRRQATAQAAFIEAFKKSGTVLGACKAIGVDRARVREWKKHPKFRQLLEDARNDICDTLESSAIQDALNGNTILKIFLLKANNPERFNDRATVKLSGHVTLADFLAGDPEPEEKQPRNSAGPAPKDSTEP
jgi:hypothetical protein